MTDSALVGYPPANQRDWWIVRGYYRAYGAPNKNPDLGIPSMKAKPGVPHGESNAAGTIALSCVMIVLLIIITSTRLGLRYFRKDLRWGPDDWMIIVGLAGVVAWFGLAIAKVQYAGVGKHSYDITYAELDWFIDLSTGHTVLFFVAAGFVKISICLFNRRLTGLTSRGWKIWHNVLLAMIAIFMLGSVLIQVFKCSPPQKQWGFLGYGRPEKPLAGCLPINRSSLPFNIMHIIFDFALLSVPLIVLSKMKMSTSKRVRLIFLFSIGSLSCIGAIMRQVKARNHSKDPTWDSLKNSSWTYVDLFFGTIAASLPVLNSLIPKKWRSGHGPSVEDPEKMAARLRNPDRNFDSDSTLDDSRELRSRSQAGLNGSANASIGACDSFEESNADGTVRVQRPTQALPRDRLNQVPYGTTDFV